jgi:lipid II:glycine glycyltransferase (peptidoglycan interpeptide bridge formation enzyme)
MQDLGCKNMFETEWNSNRDAYNVFVTGHPWGHALQLCEWGEVKGRTGWKPWRLLLRRDGEPVAAASLLERRLPVIGAPIFYCSRGPVCDWSDAEVTRALLAAIREKARERGAILLKIDPAVPQPAPELLEFLRGEGFRLASEGKNFEGVQPRFVFRLDISPSEEELLAAMHQKTRYNIRLAQKKGVTIRQGTRDELAVFYAVLKETTERDNFLVRDFSYFETLYDLLVPAGFGELFLAEYEGRVVAGTFAFLAGAKAWYIYGASSNADRNVMPNYLIQWEMIRWARERGCTLYDFRGVSGDLTEDNPLYGLYKFKKGWGGVFTEFIGEWDLVYRPFLYRVWQWAEALYSGKLRRVLATLRRG